jgi:hypothetical protein
MQGHWRHCAKATFDGALGMSSSGLCGSAATGRNNGTLALAVAANHPPAGCGSISGRWLTRPPRSRGAKRARAEYAELGQARHHQYHYCGAAARVRLSGLTWRRLVLARYPGCHSRDAISCTYADDTTVTFPEDVTKPVLGR